MNIEILLIALVVGGIFGYWSPSAKTKHIGDSVIFISIGILLFAIGAQLGANDQLLQNLSMIGRIALVLCLGSILGSVICVYLTTVIVNSLSYSSNVDQISRRDRSPSEPAADGFDWQIIVFVFVSLAAGLGLSTIDFLEPFVASLASASDSVLLLLLFGSGITIGSDTDALSYTAHIGWEVPLIPLFVAVGSILGGVFSGMVIGFPVTHSAAVAAGFGWYSYAGLIVSDLAGIKLGAIAFLANFLREIITFFVLPVTAKYLGGMTSLAPGGATTMDVTLPMIQRVSGEKLMVPALINGIVLSVSATVLIPLILK